MNARVIRPLHRARSRAVGNGIAWNRQDSAQRIYQNIPAYVQKESRSGCGSNTLWSIIA